MGTGLGVVVRGISPSMVENSIFCASGEAGSIFNTSALSLKTGATYSLSGLLLLISKKIPKIKIINETRPIVKIIRLVFFTYCSECVIFSFAIAVYH